MPSQNDEYILRKRLAALESGPGSIRFADAEAPAISGGGTTLTLAHAPSPAASLILMRGDPARAMTLERGYVLVGAVITLTVPQSDANESFLCWYRY